MHDGRDAGTVRLNDPWYDALASGWGEREGGEEPDPTAPPVPPPAARTAPTAPTAPATSTTHADALLSTPGITSTPGVTSARSVRTTADVYARVHASQEFQEVRRRYRRFVFPATFAFLAAYLAYVVMATTAPGLMARQVAGALNVAMLAGLSQFAITFLMTWAYARHARLRRDRPALELRWAAQEMEMARERTAARHESTEAGR